MLAELVDKPRRRIPVVAILAMLISLLPIAEGVTGRSVAFLVLGAGMFIASALAICFGPRAA